MSVTFSLDGTSGRARRGRLVTERGTVETPAFLPVGTRAAVKGVLPGQVASAGASMLLANACHLSLRPGAETVEALGGLHAFMGWQGPILTDSGGFQIFSLPSLVRVSDEGARFRSPYDGDEVLFTPEGVVALQGRLGSDVGMVLDHCVGYPAGRSEARAAMERTLAWAEASLSASGPRPGALFAIVQGGAYRGLRERCADALVAMDFPGYAVGGLSVGEGRPVLEEVLSYTLPRLPADRPRYVMGVGPPSTLLACVALGADLFDCVLPTRNARNAYLFTRRGVLRVRNASHARSDEPVDEACGCPACRSFSRGYLRHLFNVGEMLGPVLATMHNLAYFQDLMAGARRAIAEDRFEAFRASVDAAYGSEAGAGAMRTTG